LNNKSISLILPQDIVVCLTGAEIKLADLIFDLCRYTSKKQKSGAFYTCVGQKWLGKRLGVSREWISKCVNKLAVLGVIRITHRRKEDEKWQTNLYRVGEAMKRGWKTMKYRFLFSSVRVKFRAHKGTKKHISSTEIMSKSDYGDRSPPGKLPMYLQKLLDKIDSIPV